MNIRLQTRHTLTFLGLLAVVLAVLSGALLSQFRVLTSDMQNSSSDAMSAALRDQARESGLALGTFLSTTLQAPVYQLDFAAIGRLASSALDQQNVSYVYVFDIAGRVVHDGTTTLEQYGLLLQNPEIELALNSAESTTTFDDLMIHVTVPVVVGSQVHGGVRIGISTDEIRTEMASGVSLLKSIGDSGFRQLLLATLAITVILVFAGTIVNILLARNLVRPIRLLSDLARRIGLGEYNVDVPITRHDEVGDLARSFKEMADELARAAHRNALLATFLGHVGDAIEVINTDGEIEYTNPAHERITGYTPAEAIGRTPAVLHRPENHDPAFYNKIWETMESGQVWYGVMLGKRKNGSLWHQDCTISPVRNEKGEITHYIAIKRDITASIDNQKALAESQQRFKDYAEASSDWLWATDEDLQFTSFTGDETDIGGWSTSDAVGKTRWDLYEVDPETDENWGRHKADLEARRRFRDFRYSFRRADKIYYVSVSGKPVFDVDGKFKGYRGTANDLTAEVESEKALRESEEQLANIVANLPGRVFRRVLHADGSVSYPYVGTGDGVAPTYPWDPKSPESSDFAQHVHPEDRPGWHDALKRSADELKPHDFEFRRMLPTGGSTWVRTIGRPRKLENGDVVWDSISLDVTDRKQAEDALRASETRFRRLVENATDSFFLHDLDGNTTDANQHAADSLGYTLDELLSLSIGDIEVGHNDQSLRTIWEKLQGGEAMAVQGKHKRKDGKTFPVDVRIGGVEVDGRPHILALARDTTERDRVQRQLEQASKMATLGEMGAGIAHELNQPLQIIRIASDHCLAMLGDGEADLQKLMTRLRKISSQTGRMSQIIDHMRVLSRRDDVPPELLNPASCATSAITHASGELRRNGIPISTDFSKNCGQIVGHSVQIEQAIFNLLTNAKDAIVTARAERNGGASSEGEISGHIDVTVKEDKTLGRVKIIVADDGGGIPEAIIDRIFDPFFTTKEAGIGTGLGLSVSYGFINAMGGSLDVRNTEKGAEFTISLTAAETPDSRSDAGLSAAE